MTDMDDTGAQPIRLLRGPLRDFIEVPFTVTNGSSSMESIEVQRLEIPDGRTGHMVKIQHHGGVVDLYPEAHLGLTRAHIESDPAFTHLELAHLTPTEFDEIGLTVTPTSARCSASFKDHTGRAIFFEAATRRTRPAKPIFIPAPPHREPHTLRLLLVERFWLFSKARSSITLRIDGLTVTPKSFPALPGARHWSGRAGGGNHLSGVNIDRPHPDFAGAPQAFEVVVDDDRFEITSPLGPVVRGSISRRGGVTEVTATPCWSPPSSRPALSALSVIRRARRRGESWLWTHDGTHPNGQWSN